ncbi:hypothetical protein HC766_06945 [Candidatus Gracilibacteria bacterium]|nr:hypothetical protein [Candidatus Gracilibacteria bacterium]
MIGKLVPKITAKIKNKIGLADYKFEQFYDSQMSIWVTNHSDKTENINIICPIPLKKYQNNTLVKLIINTAGKILNEPKYNNQYICWEAKISAGQMKEFSYHLIFILSQPS